MKIRRAKILLFLLLFVGSSAWPWGNEGHSEINRVATLKLPPEVPQFLRDASAQMAYLGPEPDRWREKSELALKLSQEPDHYIDLERIAGMTLPPDRYSYIRELYARRDATPGKPDDLLPEKIGFQPYITMETFGRLVVAFREYRHALRDHRDPTFPERDAIFYAGWMGHYVGDGANPLHTTINYNGWTGPNPNGYTTEHTIHWQMEGVFVAANIQQLQFEDLVTAPSKELKDPFADYMAYLRESYGFVERVYQLQKAGGFDGAGTPESREFLRQRLAAGSTMLRDLIYTAWLQSAVDPPPYVPPQPNAKPATGTPAMTSPNQPGPPPPMRTVPKVGEDATPAPGA